MNQIYHQMTINKERNFKEIEWKNFLIVTDIIFLKIFLAIYKEKKRKKKYNKE
jgi:hypothetical protein